uniref:Uncharacterized protein n=1 Tax=viral metagenome TaxID=1070528 RepID=A0A6M3LN61_9ZZZZ
MMNAPVTEKQTYTKNASPFSAWSWFTKTSPATIAEYMDDETREEFTTCYAALLAMAED